MLKLKDVLFVSISDDPDDETIEYLQNGILESMQASKVRGLVLDISAAEMLDSYFARTILETVQMVGLMGGRTIIAGMRPHVALAATQLGLVLTGIDTALNVDIAFEKLRNE